ncbi:MAG TPA: DEAD/DEAH box helicase [Aliidongia sp.]|uniref:DEAD/DEAH box helicase n=1 Tax=Aliidongia sp. TaxID=1914230 RepID=UPI002DDD3B42|nr:DEAD/DEAH box helicase [Aliidongia sp.]HEV2677904.1 DEAD/DEAH box helicase [Aliidongia sp.]
MTEITKFSELALRPEIQAALAAEGYVTPTPIQQQAIPFALEGRDLLGIAQTGTGKTAAFTLPILQHLSTSGGGRKPGTARTLVLTPTRELAIQIGESVKNYGANLGLKHTVVFGGVGQKPQTDAMKHGVDILIATPGRLLDLMNQGFIKFDNLEAFVLDEADRMLDMGFIHDVKRVIAKLPAKRQTFFFSATMPDEVAKLAGRLLKEPVRVEVTPVATTVEKIVQGVIFCESKEKRQLLADLLADPAFSRVIIFTRTKHGANKVTEFLAKAGVGAAAIHGNKSQSARQAALEGFRAGDLRALVATDIAARGIDIDGISHVINFELPNIPESYVHRIGRTARAGAEGSAISFCDGEERAYLRDIERLTKQAVPVLARPPATEPVVTHPSDDQRPPRPQNGRGQRPQRNGRSGQSQGQAPQRTQGQAPRPPRPVAAGPVQAGAAVHPHGRPAPGKPDAHTANPHRQQQGKPIHQGPRPGQGRPEQRPQATAPRALGTFGDLVAGLSTRSVPDEQDATNEAPRRERANRR